MHKLCSLKELVPGSVIQLPETLRSKKGENAVVLGLEYHNKTDISMDVVRPQNDEFVVTPLAALPEDTKFETVDDNVLQKATIAAFVAHKFKLPALGMSTGCDPEVFVTHANGTVFPAWEYMPDEETARTTAKGWLAQKWQYSDHMCDPKWDHPDQNYAPFKVPAYWDGAQAEFAPWAKSCLETLHHGTREGLKAVLEFARAKDPGAKLSLKSVVELPASVLNSADDKFIQFRCSRSYNVYDDPGDAIVNAREYKWRCAGGHIHIGFTRTFTAPGIEQIVRGLDGVLGVIGVSLAAGIDNPERRHTYGRAGEFRLPSHGLEYRVLSNFWLSHPAVAMLVFELARATVRLSESGLYNLCWIASEEQIREVINSCDVEGARKILRRNAAVLVGMLHGIWEIENHRARMQTLALKAILNGIDSVVKDPFDIEGNWKLDKPKDWLQHCRGIGDNWKSFTEITDGAATNSRLSDV